MSFKIFMTIIIFFVSNYNYVQAKNIKILLTIDDKTITSYDIKKEINYLSLLNPEFNNLNHEQQIDVAKDSLKREIIKYLEIRRNLVLINNNDGYLDESFQSFYKKLGFEDENQLKDKLKQIDNYSSEQIKNKIKIELNWNEIIYKKFINQIKIDKADLLKKINDANNLEKYVLLSEIIFEKKKNLSIESLINQIKTSINEIGFNSTAIIYSISDTSKLGGKVGWVNIKSLSEEIYSELNNLTEGEISNIFRIGNNFVILKIDEIEFKKVEIDKDKELEKLINIETNNQLNRFSRVFYNKAKLNYQIYEK